MQAFNILINCCYQLTAAMIISTVYGMVMIAVLIGIMMQISEDGWLAPSSLFFFVVSGQLILTGLLHPREVSRRSFEFGPINMDFFPQVGCLPYGVIYYITVPSMYMLLIIYSLFNLNNVSWGTRETVVQLTQMQQEVNFYQIIMKIISWTILKILRTKDYNLIIPFVECRVVGFE